jgi:phage portal protein BeeE
MELFGLLSDKIRSLFQKQMYLRTTYQIGNKGPVWIPVDKPRELYDTIPQLRAVVDKDALMFSNMELFVVDLKGNRIEDKELQKLLEQPNPVQSFNEWLYNYRVQLNIYGNQYIYKNKPSKLSAYPTTLSNVSPKYIKPVLTGKVFEQVTLDGIISHYEYSDSGNGIKRYETDSIIYSKISDLDNPVIGCSPLQSLKYPLSNTKAAYQYRNVIMNAEGGIGILSNQSKDSMGAIPLTDEERLKIESQHRNQYGVSEEKAKFILTNASLTWQPMVYPTRDLMLFDEVDANMIAICDTFSHNVNIYSSKNATFENAKNSLIQTYQDRTIPIADNFAQTLTKGLGLDKKGLRLEASFAHIQILKEAKRDSMKSIESVVTSLTQAVQSGLLTGTQAEIILANELGITPEVKSENSNTLTALNRLSPLVANNVLSAMTVNQKLRLVGLPPVEGGDELPVSNSSPSL